jgi:hypothetical protein
MLDDQGTGERGSGRVLRGVSKVDTKGNENRKRELGENAVSSEAGIAAVRRNTEEVQNRGNFEVFEELFASDFVDHTP